MKKKNIFQIIIILIIIIIAIFTYFKFLKIENITLAVQINGKLKGTIDLPFNTDSSEIEKKALALPKVIKIIGKNNLLWYGISVPNGTRIALYIL